MPSQPILLYIHGLVPPSSQQNLDFRVPGGKLEHLWEPAELRTLGSGLNLGDNSVRWSNHTILARFFNVDSDVLHDKDKYHMSLMHSRWNTVLASS